MKTLYVPATLIGECVWTLQIQVRSNGVPVKLIEITGLDDGEKQIFVRTLVPLIRRHLDGIPVFGKGMLLNHDEPLPARGFKVVIN